MRGALSAEGVNVTKWGHPSLPWATKAGRPATEHQHQQKGTRFCLHLMDAAHSLMRPPLPPLLNLSSFLFFVSGFSFRAGSDIKEFFSLLFFFLFAKSKTCLRTVLQLSARIKQKSKAPLMSTYVNLLFIHCFFFKVPCRCALATPPPAHLRFTVPFCRASLVRSAEHGKFRQRGPLVG